jgi:hypothetical protein
VGDFAGKRADIGNQAAEFKAAGPHEDVPVITARVLHRDVDRASREAARLGGVFDPVQQVWLFRATSTFELRGGVMQLRSAGLLPLEMRYGNQLEAIWIDFDSGRRVMQWRPVGDRTRLTLRKGSSRSPG